MDIQYVSYLILLYYIWYIIIGYIPYHILLLLLIIIYYYYNYIYIYIYILIAYYNGAGVDDGNIHLYFLK
jgi:hypothetical protein